MLSALDEAIKYAMLCVVIFSAIKLPYSLIYYHKVVKLTFNETFEIHPYYILQINIKNVHVQYGPETRYNEFAF